MTAALAHRDGHSVKTVDWNGLRNRLQAAEAALAQVGTPDRAESERILKARARRLARPAAAKATGESIEVLAFRVGAESYALQPRHVERVCALDNLTPIPGVPAFVLGIVSLAGEILSVVDLRRMFELPEHGLGELNKVIVLALEAMRFGILVDHIDGIRQIPVGALQPSLPTLCGIRERYLLGVTQERVAVLDAARLLADRGLIIDERSQERNPATPAHRLGGEERRPLEGEP